MNHPRLALGIDIGTGSVRAFLFDACGRRQNGVRLRYSWRVAPDGMAEVEADEVVELTRDAIDGALAYLPQGATIVAVGIAGLWHTLLGVGGDGRATTAATGWNDSRAGEAARSLRRRLDTGAIHQRTGTILHPSYPVARLAWLRQRDGASFQRVHRWMSLPEYVWLCMTGRHVADVSMAAGSGLLDRHAMRWDPELCAATGVRPDQLAEIVSDDDAVVPGEQVRCTRDVENSRFWPQLRDAIWHLPVGDGAAANIGSGCTDATRIALSIGTSAALRVIVADPTPVVPPGLWAYRLDRETALLGGAINNGGMLREWLLSMLRLPEDPVALDALLAARAPAQHGLAFLPFLAGERSPDWPLDASAAITGMRAATSPLDVLQAGMEAVAYRLALVRERIAAVAPGIRHVVASGGAVRNSTFWAQLLADVLGEHVHLAADPEASSRGAALIALRRAGVLAHHDDCADPPARILQPDPQRHRAHARALQHHRDLADRIAGQELLHQPACDHD